MEWIPSNYSYESNVEIFGETDTCLERPREGDIEKLFSDENDSDNYHDNAYYC